MAARRRWSQENHSSRYLQRRAAAFAKADARRRALRNLVVTAFVVLAVAMAATALHRESELNQLQPQVERTP